jgi:hypothetical protein
MYQITPYVIVPIAAFFKGQQSCTVDRFIEWVVNEARCRIIGVQTITSLDNVDKVSKYVLSFTPCRLPAVQVATNMLAVPACQSQLLERFVNTMSTLDGFFNVESLRPQE